MCGALIDYITTAEELKPMYANFGLLGAGKTVKSSRACAE